MPTLCQGIVNNNYFTFKKPREEDFPTEEAIDNAHSFDPKSNQGDA